VIFDLERGELLEATFNLEDVFITPDLLYQTRLLTGDARVRARAEVIPIPCSGLLWMLDRIYETATITPFALIDGLSRITKHRRARLPKAEVEKRLARWRKESGRLGAREPVAIRYRPVLSQPSRPVRSSGLGSLMSAPTNSPRPGAIGAHDVISSQSSSCSRQ
jgi:hypothetical protein